MKNPFEPYERQFTNQDRKILLANSLKHFRRGKGYNQKQVAELLDISVATYSGYERGASEPDIETLVRLAYLYGVSTDLLLQKSNLNTSTSTEGVFKSFREQTDEMIEHFSEKKQPAMVKLVKMINGFMDQLEKVKDELPDDYDDEKYYTSDADDIDQNEPNGDTSDENDESK